MNIVVPFNNDPELTDTIGVADTYTVPAGRYAIVTVNMSTSVSAANISNPNSNTVIDSHNPSTSFSVWLDEGSLLDFSVTQSDPGVVAVPAGTFVNSTAATRVDCRINPGDGLAVISQIRGYCTIGFLAPGTPGSLDFDVLEYANAHIAQYQKQS